MTEIIPLRILPGEGVEILDQTLLPLEECYVVLRDVDSVCEAIRALRVRGAPLLGLSGACALAIAAQTTDASDESLDQAAATIIATRPTAVDLAAMVRRYLAQAKACSHGPDTRRKLLWSFAARLAESRQHEDEALGQFGADLLARSKAVLTHCNTGALATGGRGTALAVIRCAREEGTLERCFVTETRPLLQGARLTAWELARLDIPTTLLPDTAVASLIASGQIGAVITGADRIAANGDTANKVGTYGIAALAQRHGIPFYIAAPRSTFDPACLSGAHIPIEYRDPREVGGYREMRWAPDGIDVYNPAFDVTPASLISAIVTERGVLYPPFGAKIASLCDEP